MLNITLIIIVMYPPTFCYRRVDLGRSLRKVSRGLAFPVMTAGTSKKKSNVRETSLMHEN